MRVHSSAGPVMLEASTDGYPHWVRVHIDGVQVASLHHHDLPDLVYAAHRLAEKLTAAMEAKP